MPIFLMGTSTSLRRAIDVGGPILERSAAVHNHIKVCLRLYRTSMRITVTPPSASSGSLANQFRT